MTGYILSKIIYWYWHIHLKLQKYENINFETSKKSEAW